MSDAEDDRIYSSLSRIETKVDDQSTRLSRIEGAIGVSDALRHEDRIRELEISREGLEVRLGLWGGVAGIVSFIGSLIYALILN